MTKDDFLRLYEKFLAGTCSPEEKKLLALYQDGFTLVERPWDAASMGDREMTGQLIYEGVAEGMKMGEDRKEDRKEAKPLFSIGLRVAAVLLPLVVVGLYLWWQGRHINQAQAVAQADHEVYDVPPGGNKAILTLANGSSILLDSAQNGLLSQQGSAKVMKMEDGQLSYVKGHVAADRGQNVPSYNIISTPRGGQYKVILPDGSRVWLNAASSLRFPTAFTGGQRRVEVTGECYFEIARDPARPFNVAILTPGGRSMDVHVLGTSFDVMAYDEEDAVRTTLVEGAVKLEKEGRAWLLKPGQQGYLKDGQGMNVADSVDIESVTAWKNGVFEFNGNIKGIMRQIARWYDVDVEYRGDVSDKRFGGAISRAANASEVLKFLAATRTIHFVIEGRKITVIPGVG